MIMAAYLHHHLRQHLNLAAGKIEEGIDANGKFYIISLYAPAGY
jgi:hypothetical protein